jgi:hypothetical protein
MTSAELRDFVLDKLPWCGCVGDEMLERLRDILTILEMREEGGGDAWARSYAALEELLPDVANRWMWLCVIDSADLIEHGGNISGSWLTGDGHRALAALREYGCDHDQWNRTVKMRTPEGEWETVVVGADNKPIGEA